MKMYQPQKGFSLIEVIIMLIVALSIITASIFGYLQYEKSANISIDSQKINTIKDEILKISETQKNFAGLTIARLTAQANFPTNHTFTTKIGSTILVANSTTTRPNDTFTITANDISKRYCSGFVTKSNKNFTSLSIGSTNIPKDASGNFNVNAITTACDATENQSVRFIYVRIPLNCRDLEANWGPFPVANNCKAKLTTPLNNGVSRTFNATNPMSGNVNMRCDDGVLTTLGGGSCVALPCPARNITWTVPTPFADPNNGGIPSNVDVACTSPVTATPSTYPTFTSRALTATGNSSGNATYACEFGEWVKRTTPTPTCTGFCGASNNQWTDTSTGKTCSGPTAKTGFGLFTNITSNGTETTGTASTQCNPFTGSFTNITGPCRDTCIVGDLATWTDPVSGDICRNTLDTNLPHNSAPYYVEDDVTGPPQYGSAYMTCYGGKLKVSSDAVCRRLSGWEFNIAYGYKWGPYLINNGVWRGGLHYGKNFSWIIKFPADGVYKIRVSTDDYSYLYIDEKFVAFSFDQNKWGYVDRNFVVKKGYHVLRASVTNYKTAGGIAMHIYDSAGNIVWRARQLPSGNITPIF